MSDWIKSYSQCGEDMLLWRVLKNIERGFYIDVGGFDPTRIRTELGWRPSVTLEQGLEKTVRWYLDNENWWRALQNRSGVGQRLGSNWGGDPGRTATRSHGH